MDLLTLMEKRLAEYEGIGDAIRIEKLRNIIKNYREMVKKEIEMTKCRYWKDQADGFHGHCTHPEARQGETCILNSKDECVLREEA